MYHWTGGWGSLFNTDIHLEAGSLFIPLQAAKWVCPPNIVGFQPDQVGEVCTIKNRHSAHHFMSTFDQVQIQSQ